MLRESGGSSIAWVVLFSVIMATVIGSILVIYYYRQLDARVSDQAQALADETARVAFQALSGGQPTLTLPRDVGGSEFKLVIGEDTITVNITAGRKAGESYSTIVNTKLQVEISNFEPGGKIYFQRSGDFVIVSSSSIVTPQENILVPTTAAPTQFYYFSKENTKAATAIAAAYFFALENRTGIDATGYKFEGENVLVQVQKGGGNLFGVRVSGYENQDNVGKVDNAWIVTGLAIRENLVGATSSPSVENAASSGWLHSPAQVLNHLRGRTWRRVSDNVVVVVPTDAVIRATSATTNVSTYPTWRVEWQSDTYYVIYFQTMPVWWGDSRPGFVFQSSPELETVV